MPFGGILRRCARREVDDYIEQISKDEDEIKAEKDFKMQLSSFYKRKWNMPVSSLTINGCPLKLFDLYSIVKNFGGFIKCTNLELWNDVAKLLNHDQTINITHMLKSVYQRYLLYFEEAESGIDANQDDQDSMASRSRAKIYSATHECPISNAKPTQAVLATGPDYEKLLKHLFSGFENENIFVRNILAISAAPGPYSMKLEHCPVLLEVLLAKIGIFDEKDSTGFGDHYNQNWKLSENGNFNDFWQRSGIKEQCIIGMLPEPIRKNMTYEDTDLFNDNIVLDETNPFYFRVQHTAKLLRNWSFDLENRKIMKKSKNLFTFILAVGFSTYDCLKHPLLECWSNISESFDLSELLTSSNHFGGAFKFLKKCMSSSDKMEIIAGLEVLGNWAAEDCNEVYVTEFLTEDIINLISNFLIPMDVLLLSHTLETVYDLTSMGETPCEMLSKTPRFISQLYTLLTSEANRFGPCYVQGVKIVQYQNQMLNRGLKRLAPMTSGSTAPRLNGYMRSTNTPQRPLVSATEPRNQGPVRNLYQVTKPPSAMIGMPEKRPCRISPPTIAPEENENMILTKEWIRDHFEVDPLGTTKIRRGSLYLDYVNHLKNIGKFPSTIRAFVICLQEIFHNITIHNDEGPANVAFTGITYIPEGKSENVEPNGILPADHTVLVRSILNKTAEKEKAAQKNVPNGMTTKLPKLKRNEPISYEGSDLLRNSKSPDNFQPDVLANETTSMGPNYKTNGVKIIGNEDYKYSHENGIYPEMMDAYAPNTNSNYSEYKMDNVEHIDHTSKNEGGFSDCLFPNSHQAIDNTNSITEDLKNNLEVPICEWQNCGKLFLDTQKLYCHIYKEHINESVNFCEWNGCDRVIRTSWSLLSHIQEVHCKQIMSEEAKELRNKWGNEGYIKRLEKCWEDQAKQKPRYIALKQPDFQKKGNPFVDFTNEREGPVTKSVRLTSALILRNIATCSVSGRSLLRQYEGFMAYMAFSSLESNFILAQCLYEINSSLYKENEDTVDMDAS